MRTLVRLLVLLSCGWVTSLAHAQPQAEPVLFGWEDTVVQVGDLTPQEQAMLRQAWDIELDLKIGFAYRRAYLFREEFSLWNWHGRYVLFDGGNISTLPEEDIGKMIGPARFDALQPPGAYHWPAGLISLIAIAIAITGLMLFLPTQHRRVQRLLKDPRYAQAVEVYAASLPPTDDESSRELRQQAFGTATEFLIQEKTVPAAQAEQNLRLIISHEEQLRSKHLRQIALAHELASEWNEALDCYEEAAELREMWDPKDYAYLQKCIARVQEKQAAENS